MKSSGEINVYRLSQTLMQDCHRLFPFKDVPPYQFRVLVVGILGVGMWVAGLLMARRDGNAGWLCSLPWTTRRTNSRENLCLVAGLQNLGNNCFLNVILQALASCSHFRSFLKNIVEVDDLVDEGRLEQLPLTVTLTALLEELSVARDEKIVVSPRRIMLTMGHYITSFSLAKQQDAAEALLHLLSSLKKELSYCHVPHCGSLTDISDFPDGWVSAPKKSGGVKEFHQWQRLFFGPCDGTLGGILTCKTCSFQLSMDFEFFHCLPLSPVVDWNGLIIDGCTVEDCLKQFTSAEHIENYRCNRCWHIAGIKYLSHEREENEAKIEKLTNCVDLDSCDCKELFLQEGMSWPTIYSRALKKLSIGKSPEVLCIHLQRATISVHGELVKLQGHISFPLVLDFIPFTAAMGLGVDTSEKEKEMRAQVKQPPKTPQSPLLSHLNMQFEMPPHIFGLVEGISSEDTLTKSTNTCIQKIDGADYDGRTGMRCDSKPSRICALPPKSCIYRLVSVVEHYGKAGSGHYAVYRSVKVKSETPEFVGANWFYVSDTEVSSVSEDTVLAAEASLLFYERIEA